MITYEYSVRPAPKRGVKGKGIRGAEAQFANALAAVMNEAADDGWEYLRAETLPSEERQGLTGRTTVFQNMLVFRKPKPVEVEEAPEFIVEPEPVFEEPVRVAPVTVVADSQDARSFPTVLSPELRAEDREKS